MRGAKVSELVNEAIKPFQSRGLMGERHVHKKALGLPIPSYQSDDATHQKVASLALAAKIKADAVAPSLAGRTLGMQRQEIRRAAQAEMKELDLLVKRLLQI